MSERRLPRQPFGASIFSRIFCLSSQPIWLSLYARKRTGVVFLEHSRPRESVIRW